jgi:hypothetical protein
MSRPMGKWEARGDPRVMSFGGPTSPAPVQSIYKVSTLAEGTMQVSMLSSASSPTLENETDIYGCSSQSDRIT